MQAGTHMNWQDLQPEWGIVLGSGLGSFIDRVEILATVSYHEIEGLPASSVPGHAGRFVFARSSGTLLLIAEGRVHLYEGRTAKEATAGVRWMAARGVRRLILTNAAGTLNPNHPPGSWMMLTDHINLSGASPLTGGPNFVDMTEVYSKKLRDRFEHAAQESGISLHQGVYASLPGPQYETPAEIRMLRTLGADAVGMSTVLEAIQARALGLEVGGFSCLTNWAAGIQGTPLSHHEVLDTGKRAASTFCSVFERVLGPED